MKYLAVMLTCLFGSCTTELDDFEKGKRPFDSNLVGVWMLDGELIKSEYGNVSEYVLKTLSIDSSGVFMFEMLQIDATTMKPIFALKHAGTTSTASDEITLAAKRVFLFNKGFQKEYSEWKKTEVNVFDRFAFKIAEDSLYVEDMRDDIAHNQMLFIKIH